MALCCILYSLIVKDSFPDKPKTAVDLQKNEDSSDEVLNDFIPYIFLLSMIIIVITE